MLIPPDNFGMVESGFYRCLKLETDHLPFLATLHLKLLVLLDVAKPPRTLKLFLGENHVDLYNLGGMKISNHQNTGSPEQAELGSDRKDGYGLHTTIPETLRAASIEVERLERNKPGKNDLWMIIEKNLIVAAFEILLDKLKHNVLVVDLTLALVGILRKIQKWNFNSIVNEYRIYTGNASKISYKVEVFLEVIQLELVPYELDHALLRKRDEISNDHDYPRASSRNSAKNSAIPGSFPRRRALLPVPNAYMQCQSPRLSFDDDTPAALCEDEDTFSLGDYEEDLDEEILSASPQIPANLLKLVEQRNSDGTLSMAPSASLSPDSRRPSLAPSHSSSLDMLQHPSSVHRRKSSVDSPYIRVNNSRFRDPQFGPFGPLLASASPRRASLDVNLRQILVEHEKNMGDEILRLKQKHDYMYYRPMAAPANGFNVLKIRIPAEQNLALWFVRARDFWENKYKYRKEG